jgi:hypothetical protein
MATTLPWQIGVELAEEKDLGTETLRLPALLLRSALLCALVVLLKNIGLLCLKILHTMYLTCDCWLLLL